MIEGYWYSKIHTTFPMPVPNVLSQEQAGAIFALIKRKEKRASVLQTKGFSRSRIDDSIVGTKEYVSGGWYWPEGFAEHYVRDHRVRPTDAFLKFIGYNE